MDRNDYYGGESTSLNLIQVCLRLFCTGWVFHEFYYANLFIIMLLQLWKKFRGNDQPPADLGSSRDYNVDMMPKVCIIFLYMPMFANLFVQSLTHISVSVFSL